MKLGMVCSRKEVNKMFAKAVSALIGLFFGSVAFLLTWDKIDQFKMCIRDRCCAVQ